MLLQDHNYIELESMEQITPEALDRIVKAHKRYQLPRMQKLMQYYCGKNPTILNKPKVTDKPDNRIANSFARVVADQITNVFVSKPIKYSSEDKSALLELQVINAMNNVEYHDYNLAKHASIYGIGAELLYTDADAEIRFALLNPEQIIPIYSTGINTSQIGAIRYYTVESLDESVSDKHYVEVYDKDSILYYQDNNGKLQLTEIVPHFFNQCPLNVYNSSEQEISDIEPVIGLIDSYDRMLSETDNLFSYFADAYLTMSGIDEITQEDVQSMKENRIILLPEGGTAQFLVKQTDNASLADQFNRLKENIYRFSYAIPIEEQVFGNDVSGVALKYRLQMLEGVCAARERLFTQAINKRIEMCFAILGVKGKHYNADDIDLTFTRNVPSNESEAIANATALTGIISRESQLDMLPMVDALEELKRLEDEQNGLNMALDPYAGMDFGAKDNDDELPVME